MNTDHIQVYVNFGFWKPCVYASNITPAEAAQIQGAQAVLDMVFAIVGNVVSIVVTPEPSTPLTTLSAVSTAS